MGLLVETNDRKEARGILHRYEKLSDDIPSFIVSKAVCRYVVYLFIYYQSLLLEKTCKFKCKGFHDHAS